MTRPQDMDGEPWEVAAKALAQVAEALDQVVEQFEATAPQVRNARMQDALELSPAELHEAYPEAVNEDGLLAGHELPSGGYDKEVRPHEEPYEFWASTDDSYLVHGIEEALHTARRFMCELVERQPEVEQNAG